VFDGPFAGLPEPDLQNRRCGQSCGANDTTSAMCQGSTADGRLTVSLAVIEARCGADAQCVGFGQFSGSYFRPVISYASLDHSHPGQWQTWQRRGYKPTPGPPAPPHPSPTPPPGPPPPPLPPGPPPSAPCPRTLKCNGNGNLRPLCGICACDCAAFTNQSCCEAARNVRTEFAIGCAWAAHNQSSGSGRAPTCIPRPPPPHAPDLVNPCTPGYLAANTSFCDHTLPVEKRLDDALARIPLLEKLSMLNTGEEGTRDASHTNQMFSHLFLLDFTKTGSG
jgi:hypothetical protein